MSVNFTVLDLSHAKTYALELYKQMASEAFYNSIGVKVIKTEIEWDPIMLKGAKQGAMFDKRFKYSFDVDGCNKVACFKYNKHSECGPDDRNLTVNDGPNTYYACQDACRKFKNPTDAQFKDGKCIVPNSFLKTYCLIPPARSTTTDGYNKVPPFVWDPYKNTCTMSIPYCNHFSMNIVTNNNNRVDCETSKYVKAFQFLFGQTFTRWFTNSFFYQDSYGFKHWEDGPALAPTPYFEYRDFIYTEDKKDDDYYKQGNVTSRVLKELATQILEYLSIDVAIRVSPALMSMLGSIMDDIAVRVLPEAVYLGALASAAAAESIVTSGLILTVTTGAAVFIGGVLTVLNPIIIILFLANIAGSIADAIDPYHLHTELKYYVGGDTLHKVNEILNDQYAFYLTGHAKFENLVELDPVILWAANTDLKTLNTERTKFFLIKSLEYLSNLRVNSLGQIIDQTESISGISVKHEDTILNISKETQQNILGRPEFGRGVGWITLSAISILSAFLFEYEYKSVFFIVLLLAYIILCTDIMFWWSKNNMILGNPYYSTIL